ncbi:DUF4124 domain-containing protein [Permianibacter sp. IMCC34836]|uniref:DUF4124 domain-containing protein n=1 Tax=Permianibacter fluminis TaxID=2738515 RepID=UPI0015516B30|nr:DUF4124 domain-containing protein [Permianibacter fluminis]NQD35876.1 DUF4124 domain-containing protein [Permianibacter fluminis]
MTKGLVATVLVLLLRVPLLPLLLFPAPAVADIYRCPGADGSVRFSDQPCDSNSKAVTRAPAVPTGDARCERAGQIAYDTALKSSRGVGKVSILAELGNEANDPLYKRSVDIGYQYGLGAENLRKQALRECRNDLLRTAPATVSAPNNARDFTISGLRYRFSRLPPWQEIDSNIRVDDVSLTFQSPQPEWAKLTLYCSAVQNTRAGDVAAWSENAARHRTRSKVPPEREQWQTDAGTVSVARAERPVGEKLDASGYRYVSAYGVFGKGMRCDIVVESQYRGGDATRNADSMVRTLKPI